MFALSYFEPLLDGCSFVYDDRSFVVPHYSGAEGEDIEDFISRFFVYSKMNEWDSALMCEAMLMCVSGRAKMWYQHYMLTDGRRNSGDWNHLKKSLLDQFNPKEDPMLLRYELQHTRQQLNECVRDYYLRMMSLIDRIDIDMNEEAKMDYFLFGLNPLLQAKVIRPHYVDLDSLLKEVEKQEQAIGIASETMKLRAGTEDAAAFVVPASMEFVAAADNNVIVEVTNDMFLDCMYDVDTIANDQQSMEDDVCDVRSNRDEIDSGATCSAVETACANDTPIETIQRNEFEQDSGETDAAALVQDDNQLVSNNVSELTEIVSMITLGSKGFDCDLEQETVVVLDEFTPTPNPMTAAEELSNCARSNSRKDEFIVSDPCDAEWMFNAFWKGYGINQDCWMPVLDLEILNAMVLRVVALNFYSFVCCRKYYDSSFTTKLNH